MTQPCPDTTDLAAAIDDAGARAMALKPYSDGRAWNHDLVVREIALHAEQIVISGYEIGRRLVWTKEELGHGRFEAWLVESMPFTMRTAQRYMQIAEYLVDNPKLLEPMARAGLKKALLLTTLAPDQVEALLGDQGGMPEAEIEGIDKVPYHELRKEVEKLRVERDMDRGTLKQKDEQLLRAKAEIADLTGLARRPEEVALLEKVATIRKSVEESFMLLDVLVATAAPKWEDLSLRGRGELAGLVHYALRLGQLEEAIFRSAIGEAVWAHDWTAIIEDPFPAARSYPLPVERAGQEFAEKYGRVMPLDPAHRAKREARAAREAAIDATAKPAGNTTPGEAT